MGEAAYDPLHEGAARSCRTEQEQPRPLRIGEDHAGEVVEVALGEVEELIGKVEILESFSVEKEIDREEIIVEEILFQVFAEQESPLVLFA